MQYYRSADADGCVHYLQRESVLYMDLLSGNLYVMKDTKHGRLLVSNVDYSIAGALTEPEEVDASLAQNFLNKQIPFKGLRLIKGGKKR